jgi:hypothetical protein
MTGLEIYGVIILLHFAGFLFVRAASGAQDSAIALTVWAVMWPVFWFVVLFNPEAYLEKEE